MPSYSQRWRKECPMCHTISKSAQCKQCGCATVLMSKWTVRFIITEQGKSVNKRLSGYQTKAEAEKAYQQYTQSMQSGANITVENAFAQYVNYITRSLKGASVYCKISIYNKHIKPYFANTKISDITRQSVVQWRAQLMSQISPRTKNTYSVKYLNNIRAELNAFLNFVQEFFGVHNIVSSIKPLKSSNELVKEMQVYTFTEFKKLLHQINKTKNKRMRVLYGAFFSTLYYSGARVGEVLALQDADIDFSKSTMNINKSLTRKTLNGEPYKVTSPKNLASVRKIKMPNKLVQILQQYIEWKKEWGNSDKFLFGGDTPLSSYSYTLALKKFSKRAKLHRIRIHDFRHSHASLLINLGANVALVSRRLGHKNTQQTLNTYSHLFPSSENEIIKILNKLNF